MHASIVEPMDAKDVMAQLEVLREDTSAAAGSVEGDGAEQDLSVELSPSGSKQNLVEIYDSKKRRRAEEAEAILRFNQKPSAGIAFAAKCKHVDGDDPVDVARYLLKNKDVFDKTQIGEYLGREPDYQKGFSIKVLHEYVRLLDLADLLFDEAIRYFLSGFRLPGEAQKVWIFWLTFLSFRHQFASNFCCCFSSFTFRLIASWKNLQSAIPNRTLMFSPLLILHLSLHSLLSW